MYFQYGACGRSVLIAPVRKRGHVHFFIGHVKCDFRVVPVGEASIVIAVSSPHRKEALEAVHFAIDHVKATVPVWKKVCLKAVVCCLNFFF